MKLTQSEISSIVKKIIAAWKKEQLVEIQTTEDILQQQLEAIFQKELAIEDELHQEIEKLLAQYEKQFQSGTLDRKKMYMMIKAQLAKQRNMIL